MGTLANSEEPDEMLQNVILHQGLNCSKTKRSFRCRNTIFVLNYSLCPLQLYNGPFHSGVSKCVGESIITKKINSLSKATPDLYVSMIWVSI